MKAAIILFVCLLGSCLMAEQNSQEKPPLPFYDWDACPFECCTYREWTVSRPVALHRTHDKGSPVIATLESGQAVIGVTGVVITTKSGEARVVKASDDYAITEDRQKLPLSVTPGDMLYALHYQGEGSTLFWHKGKLYSGFIPDRQECSATPESCETVEPDSDAETNWWVMVRVPVVCSGDCKGGEVGWTDETEAIEHIDACE